MPPNVCSENTLAGGGTVVPGGERRLLASAALFHANLSHAVKHHLEPHPRGDKDALRAFVAASALGASTASAAPQPRHPRHRKTDAPQSTPRIPTPRLKQNPGRNLQALGGYLLGPIVYRGAGGRKTERLSAVSTRPARGHGKRSWAYPVVPGFDAFSTPPGTPPPEEAFCF